MVTTERDEKYIKDITLKSGVAEMNVIAVFEAIMITNYMSMKEKEKLYIPFFAEFTVKDVGDEIVDAKKEAKLDLFYTVHPQLKRLAGQIKDEEETGCLKNDAIDLLMQTIKSDLRTKLEANS